MNNLAQQKQFNLLINDAINGLIAEKQMVILEADYLTVHAVSPIIGNEQYEIITNNSDQGLLIKLTWFDSGTGEAHERCMKMRYADILVDLSKHADQSLHLVWERQFDLLRKISDKQWSQVATNDWDGKITIEHKPQLKQ